MHINDKTGETLWAKLTFSPFSSLIFPLGFSCSALLCTELLTLTESLYNVCIPYVHEILRYATYNNISNCININAIISRSYVNLHRKKVCDMPYASSKITDIHWTAETQNQSTALCYCTTYTRHIISPATINRAHKN